MLASNEHVIAYLPGARETLIQKVRSYFFATWSQRLVQFTSRSSQVIAFPCSNLNGHILVEMIHERDPVEEDGSQSTEQRQAEEEKGLSEEKMCYFVNF